MFKVGDTINFNTQLDLWFKILGINQNGSYKTKCIKVPKRGDWKLGKIYDEHYLDNNVKGNNVGDKTIVLNIEDHIINSKLEVICGKK
jgi:hypothetical protein